MSRRSLSTLLVLTLLAGTAAAFAVTERLKLEKAPISGTHVTRIFSPVCDCPNEALVRFKLRRSETVTLDVLREGRVIRELVFRERLKPGRLTFRWNGRDDAGAIAADGTYRVRVELAREHRTILLPNRIVLDATRPVVEAARLHPRSISPDGDGRSDRLTIDYRLSEHAHAVVFVNGVRRVVGHSRRLKDELHWAGKRPGRYGIAVGARDLAGNLAEPHAAGAVTVRYVALARRVIRVTTGHRFSVRVSTDARAVRWRFGRRRGVLRRHVLVLRAGAAGHRFLYVSERGHADRALVIVRRS